MNTPAKQHADASPADSLGRVRELGHVVLYVTDLDRSLAFYRDILGWPVVHQPPGLFRYAGFRAGNTHHDLLLIEVGLDAAPVPPGRRLGMYHFGVKVGDSDDDLRALLTRMQARPDLVTIAGTVDEGIAHSIYVYDPDGNEVELYVDLPGADWDPATAFSAPRRPLRL
jgi:catechol 2,3-dioxygenase